MPAEDAVFVLNLSNEKDPCCFPVSDGAGWSGVRRNDAPSSSPPSSSPWPGLKIGSRTKLERRATAEMVSVLVRGQLKPHASTLCVLDWSHEEAACRWVVFARAFRVRDCRYKASSSAQAAAQERAAPLYKASSDQTSDCGASPTQELSWQRKRSNSNAKFRKAGLRA